MHNQDSENLLDQFWATQFAPLGERIVTSLNSAGTDRVDVALAIMPFEGERYHYCYAKDAKPAFKEIKRPQKRFVLAIDTADCTGVPEACRSIDLSKLSTRLQIACSEPCSNFYTPDTAIELFADQCGCQLKDCEHRTALKRALDEAKSSWAVHEEQNQKDRDHDASYVLQNEGSDWKISSDIQSLLHDLTFGDTISPETRLKAYEFISQVRFPTKGIAAPSPEKISNRLNNLFFVDHTSYRHELAIAYYLDYLAFPFDSIASWPVRSYQPSAWLMVTASFDDSKQRENADLTLKKLTPDFELWELKVEAELYALRTYLFQKQLAGAFGLSDEQRLRTEIQKSSKYLFHYRSLEFYKCNGQKWKPLEEGQARQEELSSENTGDITFPKLQDASKVAGGISRGSEERHFPEVIDLEFTSLTEPAHNKGEIAPVLVFDTTWHSLSTGKDNRQNFFLKLAYAQLLNETQLLHGVVQRNQYFAVGDFVKFLKNPDRNVTNSFLHGLREVIGVCERLSSEIPPGSDELRQLCSALHPEFRVQHNLFCRETSPSGTSQKARPLELDRSAEAHAARILEQRLILDLILRLRDKMHENTLDRYLLLHPLTPSWSAEEHVLLRDTNVKDGRIWTASLLKAWSRNAIWVPHLFFLQTPCDGYGQPIKERDHLSEKIKAAARYVDKRLVIEAAAFRDELLLSIMLAFAHLCKALQTEKLELTLTGANQWCVALTYTPRGSDKPTELEEVINRALGANDREKQARLGDVEDSVFQLRSVFEKAISISAGSKGLLKLTFRSENKIEDMN